MKPYRSERASLPAVIASVGFLAVLVAVQILNHELLGGRGGPANVEAPFWRWLLDSDNRFFGDDPLRRGHVLLSTLAAGAVVLLVGYVGSRVVVRGLAPGSSVVPMFAAVWLVLVLASVLACAAAFVVRYSDSLGDPGAGGTLYAYVVNGATYGVRLGGVSALVAAVVWLVARPKPVVPVVPVAPETRARPVGPTTPATTAQTAPAAPATPATPAAPVTRTETTEETRPIPRTTD